MAPPMRTLPAARPPAPDQLSAVRVVSVHAGGVNNPHSDGNMLQVADAIMTACDIDGDGSIDYKEFVNGLARDKAVGMVATTATAMKRRKVGDPLADPLSKLKPGVTADDLVNAHQMVRERLLIKYDTIHKAFKYMDADGSGFINREEAYSHTHHVLRCSHSASPSRASHHTRSTLSTPPSPLDSLRSTLSAPLSPLSPVH